MLYVPDVLMFKEITICKMSRIFRNNSKTLVRVYEAYNCVRFKDFSINQRY
jgi:hypothetical protein